MLQQQNSSRTIYLAEDDEDDSILFLDALHDLNTDIILRVFRDGQQLSDNLHEILRHRPEIIFLDINMPCKNGFECLKEIRGIRRFDDVKVIMFSTSSSMLHIELSYRLGADLYAVKPGSFQQLKELLAAIIATDWSLMPRDKTAFLLRGGR